MRNRIVVFQLVFLFFLLFECELFSTPEFAFWTGNKCSKCHVNPQGGGVRTEFGWKFLRDASYFPIGNETIQKIYSLFDKEKYAYDLNIGSDTLNRITFEKGFAFGYDFRLQMARSHKTELARRKVFPMEAGFYISITPSPLLNLNAQYNLGRMVFQGQDDWMASANLDIGGIFPSLRVGKFQPSVGIRDCDMTSFDRRIASIDGTSSLFPPDYSEFGAELSFNKLEFFDLFVGAFHSRFLSKVTIFGNIPIVSSKNPSFTAKAILYPPLLDEIITHSLLGSSILINGNFVYTSSFIGFGILDNLVIYGELATSSLKGYRETTNWLLKAYYVLTRGIIPFARYEIGKTDLQITPQSHWKFNNKQILLGIKIFPMPYLEIISEYRYLKTVETESIRWALQIHLYY